MQRQVSVAIVGLGPRGLSILERIVTLARRADVTPDRIRVEVIDPSCCGTGIHERQQPDYLLLNTVCSQISMFPESASVGDDVDEPGPSLREWADRQGLRVADDGFTVGREGRPIRAGDFLPRRLLGEYLTWFLERLLDKARDHVLVNLRTAAAVDIRSQPDGRLRVVLDDGSSVTTQYAFLTTGHTPNAQSSVGAGSERRIADPYPLPAKLAAPAAGEAIAIGGFGLAAMDVIAACTVGRGGRFAARGDGLRYIRSGAEPQLCLYSASGVPFRARPDLRAPRRRYSPLLLTSERIDGLRAVRGPRLDFDRDVLPLLLTEMRIAYHRHRAALAKDAEVDHRLVGELTRSVQRGEIAGHLDELDRREAPFHAHAAWDRSSGIVLTDSAGYGRWATAEIRRDLVEAASGVERSSEKAALEVVRELRDIVRYAVDFGGLTAASLDAFMRHTVPLMNKAVVGPQLERHMELIALMDAGVVHIPFGPAPRMTWDGGRWTIASTRLEAPFSRQVDWICAGHVSSPSVSASASPLIGSLYGSGLLRRHQPDDSHVASVDLDTCLHPVGADGQADRRLWALGPLCEGTTFYNHLVPSPGGYSRVVSDAHRAVSEMLATTSAHRPLASPC